jgi:hypothetical protein
MNLLKTLRALEKRTYTKLQTRQAKRDNDYGVADAMQDLETERAQENNTIWIRLHRWTIKRKKERALRKQSQRLARVIRNEKAPVTDQGLSIDRPTVTKARTHKADSV